MEGHLTRIVVKHAKIASELGVWMGGSLPEGSTILDYPESHHWQIRTNKIWERVSQEFKRRTRDARTFSNRSACLRLVSLLLMEIKGPDQFTGKELHNQNP